MYEKDEILNAEEMPPDGVQKRIRMSSMDFRLILYGSGILLELTLLSQWLEVLQPLRLILGLVFILFIPGYCLTAALFPRNDDLDAIERVGLSFGLSIAWAPVLALILDWLPFGLRLWPIFIGELISITLFCALALIRRKNLPVDEAFVPLLEWQPRIWWSSLPTRDRRIYQFILASLTLTVLALSWTFIVPTPDQHMTEFYMLGPGGVSQDFPRQVKVGEQIGVTLGLVNQEEGAHIYRIEVWAVDPWAEGHRQLVQKSRPFQLEKGNQREWPVTWLMPWPGENQVVELQLFDGNGQTPYRLLKLWLNVK